MKKIVKQYGKSLVIVFNSEDREVYNIELGDFVDLSDMVIIKARKSK